MPDQNHINIYAQGKDSWNAWVNSHAGERANFRRWHIHGDLDFSGFEFPKGIDFSEANILGSLTFKACRFTGPINFQKSKFSELDLSDAVFSSKVDCSALILNGLLNLEQAVFEQDVSFQGFNTDRAIFRQMICQSEANFGNIDARSGCDFTDAEFQAHVNFSNSNFRKGSTFGGVRILDGAEFKSASFGVAEFDGAIFDGNISFHGAKAFPDISMRNITLKREGSIDFSDRQFEKALDFEGSKFYGDFNFRGGAVSAKCSFRKCTFSAIADFSHRSFSQGVSFAQAKFRSSSKPDFQSTNFGRKSSFQGADFNTPVSFSRATISSEPILFDDVKFEKSADFRFVEFLAPASFIKAVFGSAADFRSIDSKYEFDLSGSRFSLVPNFLFAQFTEPPSFEGVEVSSPLSRV